MNKLDVRQRLVIPAELADFLDELQEELGLPNRREAVLAVIREARRKRNHAVTQREYRTRQKSFPMQGQRVVKG